MWLYVRGMAAVPQLTNRMSCLFYLDMRVLLMIGINNLDV